MTRTKTVTVAIGRNIGDEPMDDDRWTTFKSDTVDALAFNGYEIHSTSEGTGYYQGKGERTFVVVASVEPRFLAGLYHILANLAGNYEQDSIALTTGETSFPGEAQ